MPTTGTVRLTLKDLAGLVTGTLDIDGPSRYTSSIASLEPFTFAVNRAVSASGELHLEGFRDLGPLRGIEMCGPTSVGLTDWNSTRMTGLLQGRITLSVVGFNGFCSSQQTIRTSSDLVDVRRLK
jgi:hypothetical protein